MNNSNTTDKAVNTANVDNSANIDNSANMTDTDNTADMENLTDEADTAPEKPGKLWTKNFTIITVGSIISMVGNTLSGFATALLILDYTKSTFLYAIYMIMYSLPQMIAPTLAGPFIDKFSRRKTIYTLDFLTGIIYAIFAAVIFSGHLNYVVLLVGCTMLGTINSIYMVAYDSFYPMLVSKGNYSKAYSISSTLESIVAFMVPVSAFVYNLVGIGPLFLIDMASFFIAAIMETQIHVEEKYVKKETEHFGIRQYKKTFREGLDYLKLERGLLVITIYFLFSNMCGSAEGTLALPYFKGAFQNGEYLYVIVMGGMMVGRLIGGAIHYKAKIPADKKFAVAFAVYSLLCILGGTYLYCPVWVMIVMCFCNGIMGVTSYNIRISATQSYVPDERKGRFNGIFIMLTTIGTLCGQFVSGLLSEWIPERPIISIFMAINLLAAVGIVYTHRKYVKPIYNRAA